MRGPHFLGQIVSEFLTCISKMDTLASLSATYFL